MPSDYGYINARLKGQHGKLLRLGAYEELLTMPDFEAFVKWLASSPYSKEWQEAQARFSGLEAAEEALSAGFYSSVRMMKKISEGRPGRLIAVIIRRWDIENLKAVIRGIHNRWDADEIFRGVLPAGNLDKVKLAELCRKNDLRDLADTLATWNDDLSVPITKALPEYEKNHNLSAMELEIDKFYYYQSLKELSGMDRNKILVRDMFRKEIDLLNIKSLRRLMARSGGDIQEPSKYYLPGGKLLTLDKYAALLDPKESKKALRSLKGTALYRRLVRNGSGTDRDDAPERNDWHEKAGSYRGDPLGIDVALGFLWQKYFEVVNLRLIARGKHFGLPAEDIREQFLAA